MTCSGVHRKLGTHISQVRSVTLDTWTPTQIARFQKLGNSKAEAYFEACLPAEYRRPHSSDSMPMEAFIRDKYERRRYITVENGGLGGEDPTSASRVGSQGARRSGLGPRPAQRSTQTHRYDDGGRPAAPTSYAARFGGGAGGNAGLATGGGNKSRAMQATRALARAATVQELAKMGFATPLALRAVEASDGDLHRALDWLLRNAGGDNSKTGAAPSSTSQPPAKKLMPDLLDFGADDFPASPPPQQQQQQQRTTAPPPPHVSDFADFGDFESALPSPPASAAPAAAGVVAKAAAVTASTTSKQAQMPLRQALADFYKPGATPAARGTQPSAGRARPITTGLQPHAGGALRSPTSPGGVGAPSLPLRPTLSPTAFAYRTSPRSGGSAPGPVQMAQRKEATGMPTINLGELARAAKTQMKVKAVVKQASNGTANGAVNVLSASGAHVSQPQPLPQPQSQSQPQSQPPPPPMQDAAMLPTSDGPSPPSPSKESAEQNGTAKEHGLADNAGKAREGEKEEESEAPEEPEEEEDPFAALSMMALSSATLKKKKAVAQPSNAEPVVKKSVTMETASEAEVAVPRAGSVENGQISEPPTEKTVTTTADIDDLLGL